MPELCTPPRISGDELTLDDYLADFNERFWRRGNTGAWKLERRQDFRQPESASWKAFNEGRWDLSIRLLEERRPTLVDYFDRVAAHGFVVRRVRVVEEPLSPYLIWELNSLLIRYQSGASISVVDAAAVASWERDGLLPEIFVIGPDTVYEVRYDADGEAEGAVRCGAWTSQPHGAGRALSTICTAAGNRSTRISPKMWPGAADRGSERSSGRGPGS